MRRQKKSYFAFALVFFFKNGELVTKEAISGYKFSLFACIGLLEIWSFIDPSIPQDE